MATTTEVADNRSVVTGQIPAYIQALRESDVPAIVTAWNPMQERSY